MRGRRSVVVLAVVAALLGAALIARPFLTGLSFVVRAADLGGVPVRLASIGTHAVVEREVAIDVRGQSPLRGRLYVPDAVPRRYALLVSGLHAAGINEPRLVAFARQLAASGMAIVTPAIPELEVFGITPAITDDIEAAALWLSRNPGVVEGDGRVGVIGISFSGGLSIVAAGRPSLRDKVAYVLSIGGHDDLPRVLRYLCTGLEPPMPRAIRVGEADDVPQARPPHDYGVAVMMLGLADELVPAAQVDPLRAAIRRFLQASSLDSVDKSRSEQEFAALREVPAKLPEPSRRLLMYLNDRDVIHLGARLLPYVQAYGGDPALSVSRSPKPSAPVFLLHGTDDNVIPSVESAYLADELRGHVPVRLLLSDLISHAAADRPARATDIMALADFWGDVLAR